MRLVGATESRMLLHVLLLLLMLLWQLLLLVNGLGEVGEGIREVMPGKAAPLSHGGRFDLSSAMILAGQWAVGYGIQFYGTGSEVLSHTARSEHGWTQIERVRGHRAEVECC